jgi:hypothetical protein
MAAMADPGAHNGDKRPLRDIANNNRSRVQWAAREIQTKLNAFLTTNPAALGNIEDKRLKMPRSHSDGRVETWEKKLAHILTNLDNRPTSSADCWLVECPEADTSGYPMFKINPKTKYRIHRVLHCIYNPTEYVRVQSNDQSLHLSHRCGWGKVSKTSRLVCVSPYHVLYLPGATNQDHKGCKYGCAATCPHAGFCVWTWRDTGKPKPCFNQNPMPAQCTCTPQCSHSIQAEDDDDADA